MPLKDKVKQKKTEKSVLTEDADSIVEGDNDDVSIAGQDAPINHVTRPLHIGPSMDVDHHRLGPSISYVCKSGHH